MKDRAMLLSVSKWRAKYSEWEKSKHKDHETVTYLLYMSKSSKDNMVQAEWTEG